MTCGICRRSQRDGFREVRCEGVETVETCPTGEIPKLLCGNERFSEALLRQIQVLRDGFGGVSAANLQALMDAYGVPVGQRPVCMEKAAAMIRGIDQVREEERDRD